MKKFKKIPRMDCTAAEKIASDHEKEVISMRRIRRFALCILCVCLLCVPVRAESEKAVALTFDDGPSGRFTLALLKGLSERGAKATFFLCGYRIEDSPGMPERILAEGHEIGLHGFSHDSMEKMNRCCLEKELDATRALLPKDCPIRFLRPPGGLCGKCTDAVTEERGLSVLKWSVDPKDWATHDVHAVERAVLEKVRDGDVILMHDMSDSSVEAALHIVDALQKRGFSFVTASELAAKKGVTLTAGKVYSRF